MAVPAKKYNFPDHTNGDTFEGVQFTVVKNLVALNLTGATIRMFLRTQKLATATILELTTDNNKIVITNAASGVFQVVKQIIEVATPATYFYDIEIEESNGEVHTYIEGTWKIEPDVTR